MSAPTPQEISQAINAQWTPERQARLLYHQMALRLGYWIAVAKSQQEAEDFVKKEMEEYDKAHSSQS